MMKISTLTIGTIVALSIGGTCGVSVANASTTTTQTTSPSVSQVEQEINLAFSNLSDTDLVTPQTGGGYIHNPDGSGDSNAITVSQAKQIMLANYQSSLTKANSLSLITPLSSSFPTTAKPLSPGQEYISGTFSGSGWQYSGYKFYNTSGSRYMQWENLSASGQVMDASGSYILKYLGADQSFVNVYDPYSIYQIYGLDNPGNSGAVYLVLGE